VRILVTDKEGLGPVLRLLREQWEVVHTVEVLPDEAPELLTRDGGGLVMSLSSSRQHVLDGEQWATRRGLLHLPVLLEDDASHAIIGPLTRPNVPGCMRCLLTRLAEAGLASSGGRRPPRALGIPPGGYQALATLIHRLLEEDRPSTVYELEWRTLRTARRHLLPVGTCSCGAGSSNFPEQGGRFHAEGGFLRQPLSSLQGVERLVDERLGPVLNTRREQEPRNVWPTVTAQAAVSSTGARVYGIGRAPSFEKAQLVAILEALERYCGLIDRTGSPRVRASFRELGERALDPRRVGLYTAGQYATPGFPCRPFDEEEQMEWRWGWSVTHGRAMFVPAELAFYGENPRPRLVAETSNGCAMASSPTEALLFGLLELIERDAALRLWHLQQPAPRLELDGSESRTASILREQLARAGYTVLSFDVTSELAMPVALLVALRTRGEGAAALCASAAHPLMAEAVEKALSELASMAAWGSALGPAEWARAEELSLDLGLVRDIDDHMLAMAVPSALERLAFLTEGSRETRRCLGHASPDRNLADLVRRLADHGFELIAVDQTVPTLRSQGLHCVRAIVPGLIPMSYGALLRRAVLGGRGGPRWAEAAVHPFS